MGKHQRKIFQAQLKNMVSAPARCACPVCGRPFDPAKSSGIGYGETITVKIKGGIFKTIPRFVDTTYSPCGCTETFDRVDERQVKVRRGDHAESEARR